MRKLIHVCSAALLAATVFAATDSSAQTIDPRRGFGVGVSGFSTDMWTQAMSGLRLFTPHRDNCNSTTEVFVKIYNNSNNVDFGFCMDKDEHSSGAMEFEDARQKCLDDGKRLPEPVEFKLACQIGTGFSNTTDDLEWGSNFTSHIQEAKSPYRQTLGAYLVGNGSCKNVVAGPILRSDSVSGSYAFRCVR